MLFIISSNFYLFFYFLFIFFTNNPIITKTRLFK